MRGSKECLDLGRTVLPIAAAGTATHPTPDDSRGHHLRLVKIFDDDTALLEERFFSADVEEKDGSRVYPLQTLDDVRHQRYEIFSKSKKYVVGEIRKKIEITLAGYSRIEINYRQCRVTAKDGLFKIPVSLRTERPSYWRGIERTADSLSSRAFRPGKGSDLYRFVGDFDLGRLWKENDGAFHYGYSCRLINGHVLTGDEFARHYGGTKQESEWASITADVACDLLILEVQFPRTYNVKSLQFRAVAEYVPAPLRGTDDERLDRGQTKEHDEETDRISGNIREEENGRVFTCPQPVPGMIYKLRWTFPSAGGTPPPLNAAAMVQAAQEKLLGAATTAATKTPLPLFAQVRSLLVGLARDISSSVSGSDEPLDVSLMVFDESSNRLRFVGTNVA